MASEASLLLVVVEDDDAVCSVGMVVVGSIVSMLFSSSHLCFAIATEFGSIV